jgi:hypothetical protein
MCALALVSGACGLSGQGTAVGGGDGGHGHGGGVGSDDATVDDGGAEGAALPADSGIDTGSASLDAGDAPRGADAGDAASSDASDEVSDGAAPDSDAAALDAGQDAPADTDGTTSPDGTAADAAADQGVGPEDAGADSGDASVDAGSSCDFNGTWGSRLTINVSWQPQGLTSIILASGTGQIKQWIKGVRTQTGTTTSDATVVCGVILPDFQETALVGGETYGVRFPNSLFDNTDGGAYLPTFTVAATLSRLTPGATYSTSAAAALLGLSMAHPTTDPWPATVTTEVDMDRDTKPGVTIDVAQGSPYSDVPTGLPGIGATPRANKLYVAIRQVTSVSGTVDDCDHMSGTVSIPQISSGGTSKYAIDSHVIGCALAGGGDCTTTAPPLGTAQAAFVDNTQPVFTPSGTTDFHSVRLATGATCADVRAALP